MLNYIEYLGLPTTIAIAMVVIFLILQIIGEFLEFKGKVVPEFIKIRKYFFRKKQERKIIHDLPETLKGFKELLNDVKRNCNSDNICLRDNWIKSVNKKLENTDAWIENTNAWIEKLDKKLDKNNEDTLSILIDNKRNSIINFASYVIDEKNYVTREQFNRVFKLYEEYENIIEKNSLKNGEVNIAFRIITESYEKHMREHSFIEDTRGYNYTNKLD